MFLVTELNDTQMEYVKKMDYYQPDDRLDEDVTRLVEWMSKQPHLPVVTDRKWLSHFIVGCKYNLYKATQTIDKYFVTRAEHPEFLCSPTREQIGNNLNFGLFFLLPNLTPEAHRVFFNLSFEPLDDFKFDYLSFCKAVMNTLDMQMNEEPMRGEIFVIDLKHIKLNVFLGMSPITAKKTMDICHNSFPLIVKSIHLINPPSFIGQIISFAKIFLNNKLKNRIHVHDTLETLYEFVPKYVLPNQYGGTAGDINQINSDFIDHYMTYSEWLDNRPKADLSKRVDQPNVENFGVEGTFKQLQID